MLVVCDKCKRKFELEYKERYIGAMITETFFKCDVCGHKYHAFYVNAKCRRLIKEGNLIEYQKEYARINPTSKMEMRNNPGGMKDEKVIYKSANARIK